MTQVAQKSNSESNPGKRNIRWYSTYMGLSGACFWLAIFFLYFESKLSIAEVLRIEAIYYFSVFLLEVPTGYFSDKFGKVKSLRISSMLFLISYVVFFSAQGFWTFALGQIFFAGGIAFQSGTETAFHYASLSEINAQDSYSQRESKVGAILNLTGGLAALTGSIVGTIAFQWAYGLNILTALAALLITFIVFREPEVSDKNVIRFGRQLSDIANSLRNPMLRFLFFASFSMIILVHIPYEYYQPFIAEFIQKSEISKLAYISSIWMNGVHAALAMIIASLFAAYSTKLKELLGVKKAVLLSLLMTTAIIFLMSSFLTWWVALIVVLRSSPTAFLAPILNAQIVPRLDIHLRATYLSVQSMAGRLGFSVVLIGLSLTNTDQIATMLGYSTILGLVLILINSILASQADSEST